MRRACSPLRASRRHPADTISFIQAIEEEAAGEEADAAEATRESRAGRPSWAELNEAEAAEEAEAAAAERAVQDARRREWREYEAAMVERLRAFTARVRATPVAPGSYSTVHSMACDFVYDEIARMERANASRM